MMKNGPAERQMQERTKQIADNSSHRREMLREKGQPRVNTIEIEGIITSFYHDIFL
jgi:hypothetical protein